MSTYAKANKEVQDRAKALIDKYYGGLKEAGVRIDFLFAHAPLDKDEQPKGPAIRHRGIEAAGLCRVVGLKDRVKGHGDVEIIIDGDQWPNWSPGRRDALIDHELMHIQLQVDGRSSVLKLDDHGRPKIRMRPHSFEFGWFTNIAERHGSDSFEVEQANYINLAAGRIYFQPELLPAAEPEEEPAVANG